MTTQTYENLLAVKNLATPVGGTDPALLIAVKDNSGNRAALTLTAAGKIAVDAGAVPGDATAANQATQITAIGSLTETPPASDTASSGTNGRLQRIAQRITALIAQVPAALGQGTKAQSMSVALASNDDLVTAVGAKADAKNAATDTTPISIVSILKQLSAYLAGFLGVVGKAAVVPVAMTRPADTTAYAGGDMFGTTAANSATNIFTLPVSRVNDSTVIISRIRAKMKGSVNWAGKQVRFHFFKNQPTVTTIGDNGAFGSGSAATESNKIGTATVTFDGTQSSDGIVKGFTYPDDTAGVIWTVEPSTGTQNIFAVAEVLSAVTPASQDILTLTLEVAGQN